MHKCFLSLCLIAAFVVAQPNYDFSKLKREHLGRGVIAIRENPSTVAVSWRYLSSDPMDESLMFIETVKGKQISDKKCDFLSGYI